MERKSFLKTLALLPFTGVAMKLNELNKITAPFGNTEKMPVLFLGHGSPMNAIEENEFVQGFRKVGKEIPKPNAIIVVSAHWETNVTFVTAMEKPKTIHDFGGFPKELYEVQYPAPGNPELAKEIKSIVKKVYNQHGYTLDPHGAVGYMGLNDFMTENQITNATGIFLETAHPAKFYEEIESILGHKIDLPENLAQVMQKPKHSIKMAANITELKKFLLK